MTKPTAPKPPAPPKSAEDLVWCLRLEMKDSGASFIGCTRRPTWTDLKRLRDLIEIAMETVK